ncbi:MAG: GntR family transcriptional regulator [Phyllobacteriaceae bacterium]|jgi:DNA-binding GntR family transcriptional regulator|nr:GntR family transcriptional regulator [Phyllobacteriaceae bacterium]
MPSPRNHADTHLPPSAQGARRLQATDLIAARFVLLARDRGPRYLVLHRTITKLVHAGELRPGEQLPSDDELARTLSLSVGTIQKTMALLHQDALVERRQGAGTFVTDPSANMADVWHFRFLDDAGEFLPLRAEAQFRNLIENPGAWSFYMEQTRHFLAVRRFIEVGDEFSFFSDFYFDGDRFGELANEPLQSFSRLVLRNLLMTHFSVRAKPIRQLLAHRPMTADECVVLGLPRGTTAMQLETFGADPDGVPVYYQKVIIPPNGRKLVLDEQ